MKHTFHILIGFAIISCSDEMKEPKPQITADFTMEVDDLNYFKVQFTNTSKNATTFSWDFGNGDSSNLENPNYKYVRSGSYDVTLKVYGADGNHGSKVRPIVLPDVQPPLSTLSGIESKTWKLYRIGAAASFGPDSSRPDSWWSGFYNDGYRSCLYRHEFIFYANKTFEFKDYDGFWGDLHVWPSGNPVFESCFAPSTNSMMVNDTDLSLWLSGTHSYDFDITNGMVILRGKGVWIGLPSLGSTSNHGTNMPDSVAFTISIEQMPTFDLMTVNFDYGEDGLWTFRYVNYKDWQDEPPLVE